MGIGAEPFDVESETQVHLLGGQAAVLVGGDGGERGLDAGVVFCDVVSSVHEVVGHDVEEVEGGADGGDGGRGDGEHVSRQAWDGGGDEFLGAQGGADFGEE